MSDSGVEVTSTGGASVQSSDEKFEVLYSVVGRLPDQEIVDAALNLLVNGKFDLEASFIISSGETLLAFLAFIRKIESNLQARISTQNIKMQFFSPWKPFLRHKPCLCLQPFCESRHITWSSVQTLDLSPKYWTSYPNPKM